MRYLTVILALCLALPALAGERLGGVGVFTNDFLGDRKDRWRTASGSRSELYALATGAVEYRLRFEMIAPERIWREDGYDRHFVGLLGLAVLAHGRRDGWEWSLGGELAVIGPQTGLGEVLDAFHDRFDYKPPLGVSYQLGNAVLPTVLGEAARSIDRGPVRLRPYLAAQIGMEDFARVGADILIGDTVAGTRFVREPVTGALIGATRQRAGAVVSLGGDLAYIAGSDLMAAAPGRWRWRARAGMDLPIGGLDVFYGLSWLGPELADQGAGQMVGSVAAFWRF